MVHETIRILILVQDRNFKYLLASPNELNIQVEIEIEPKIHAGFDYSDPPEPAWIEHPSREEQLLAIQEDIRYALDNYTSQSGFMKIAGLPLIGISGVHSLDPTEWETILSGLEEQGYAFILM